MTLDECHYYIFFVAITCGKVSVQLWKCLENSGNFFSLTVATLYRLTGRYSTSTPDISLALNPKPSKLYLGVPFHE